MWNPLTEIRTNVHKAHEHNIHNWLIFKEMS